MEEFTMKFITDELGKLRTAVFSAINDVRLELGKKIDDSANERRTQIAHLTAQGCAQGQIDRFKTQDHDIRLEKIEGFLLNGGFAPVTERESDRSKKFNLSYGKLKTAISGFKASDVVLIIMACVLGGILLMQQHNVATLEAKLKELTVQTVGR